MRRNCSLSSSQLLLVFAWLCLASLTVATFFTLRGAWYVLCFAVLELSAVGWAFLAYARHATDRERFVVELEQKESVRRFGLDARTMRVNLLTSGKGLIALESDGARVEVGRYLVESRRREFARELRRALTLAK